MQELAMVENPVAKNVEPYDSGLNAKDFYEWLKAGVVSGEIPLNQKDSPVHIVSEGVFVLSPLIFKLYLSHVGESDVKYRMLSRRFLRLGINIKKSSDMNFQTYYVSISKRKTNALIHGMLFSADKIYGDTAPAPVNPYLRLMKDVEKKKQSKQGAENNKQSKQLNDKQQKIKTILAELDGLSVKDVRHIINQVNLEVSNKVLRF